VRAAAVALLARREHSAHELVAKLDQRGYDPEVAKRVLDDLERRGLLSDTRYVSALIAQRAARGHGPLRIRNELRASGVDAALVEAEIERSERDWSALATEVRRKRFGEELPGDWPERARQSRFLQYRGFTGDQIRSALGGASFDTDA
jgi:regulatory protein